MVYLVLYSYLILSSIPPHTAQESGNIVARPGHEVRNTAIAHSPPACNTKPASFHGQMDESIPHRLAIVQWTHTSRMKPMLIAARNQIKDYAPIAEHHIVLFSCGDPNVTKSCKDLRDELQPLTENVSCSNAHDVASTLPAFRSIRHIFRGGKVTMSRELEVGRMRWCWNSCDGPYLLWYRNIGRMLTHVNYFWFLEWDVAWTGNIVAILAAWSSRNGASAVNETLGSKSGPADLLCANPAKANRFWAHGQKRDAKLVPRNKTWHCVTEVFRVTHRLLSRVVAFSNLERGGMFCEMRTPSVCAMEKWCTVRSFFDDARLPLLFSSQFNGSRQRDVTRSTTVARDRWVRSYIHDGGVSEDMLTDMHRPMLFHAFKWTAAGENSSTFAKRLMRSSRVAHSRAPQTAHSPGAAQLT